MEFNYEDHSYIDLEKIEVTHCYLCGEKLSGVITPDHIIPDKLYPKGSIKKPVLPVHDSCNNSKSKDDEWFIRATQLMASLNKDAFGILKEKLLDKALSQRNSFNVKGIRDYKLAISLLDKNKWGEKVNGNFVLYVGDENAERTAAYMKQLCRGLYLRNVPGALVDLPELNGVQFAVSVAQGRYNDFANVVRSLTQFIPPSGFFQDWGGIISYSGSSVSGDQNKGFVYVELYGEVGYLAIFK